MEALYQLVCVPRWFIAVGADVQGWGMWGKE
jgi:hypothetical protein